MNIYLVSLIADEKRRIQLTSKFPKNYPNMKWIKAVDGKDLAAKEYFLYIKKYLTINKKLLTPSEVGCTLSHIKVLKEFLKTSEKYCLILEDDIVGQDEDIEYLENLIKKIDFNGVLVCGGQDGLNYWKYILGKKYIDDVYIISNFSIRFIARTCCYVVSRDFAIHLLNYHKSNLSLADDWFNLLKNTKYDFIYSNVLHHPLDLSNSHIENERANFYINETNFFKRVLKQGVLWKIYNRIRIDIHRWILILKGYKKIHKDQC